MKFVSKRSKTDYSLSLSLSWTMSGRSRFPFTAVQWQELEHQALIFKYMISGIPIPPYLLFSIKRSSFDSHDGGLSYSPMGMRKIDPEPGRCRRTDGKKWRCSKEAYPDSKYCERHMHRGKNRSRKPVEVFKSTPLTPSISSLSKISPPLSSISHSLSPYSSHLLHPSFNHLSPLLDSGFYSNMNPDNRYFHGMKEEVDEHPFFSETPTGAIRDFSASSLDEYYRHMRPSSMSCSSSSSKNISFSVLQGDYSTLQVQSLNDPTKNNKDEMSIPMEKEPPPEKTVHRFFDEWPPRDRESWRDLEGKSSNSGFIASSKLFPQHP